METCSQQLRNLLWNLYDNRKLWSHQERQSSSNVPLQCLLQIGTAIPFEPVLFFNQISLHFGTLASLQEWISYYQFLFIVYPWIYRQLSLAYFDTEDNFNTWCFSGKLWNVFLLWFLQLYRRSLARNIIDHEGSGVYVFVYHLCLIHIAQHLCPLTLPSSYVPLSMGLQVFFS